MSSQLRKKKIPSHWLSVATLGRVVGLKGDMRLNIQSDFAEQFRVGETFFLDDESKLTISAYDENRNIVRFENITNPEDAKKLTNRVLYSTIEQSRELCELKEGEFFWFDIIGCGVIEDGKKLGVVKEIERFGTQDYLLVATDESLVKDGFATTFLIPYIDRFIIASDIEAKIIKTDGAFDILEAS